MMELLAPAGGMEALHAALQNGADAVYLGAKSHSARKNAKNFDPEELRVAVQDCHERGVKVHLTLNTLMHAGEEASFAKAIEEAAALGIDALIVQDLGVAAMAQRICPSLELHASTQLSAHNSSDVRALTEMGFRRVVLARELSAAEIGVIARETGAELEVFAHGALCISCSGRCLMSSMIGGRSGNRGECAQPCRKLYRAEGKRAFWLSPRDLCLADELDALQKAGVASIKIEGRMKSPEYVATVTRVYRDCLDRGTTATEEEQLRLKQVFVRGNAFTHGYFGGENTPQMMNYDQSNDAITHRADKTVLKEAQQSYREGQERKRVSLTAQLVVREGKPMTLTLDDGTHRVMVCGNVAEAARTTAVTEAQLGERMEKLGGTPYTLQACHVELDDGLAVSVGAINALRRAALEAISEARRAICPLPTQPFSFRAPQGAHQSPILTAQVSAPCQVAAAQAADRVYLPLHLAAEHYTEKTVVVLPDMIFDEAEIEQMLRALPSATVMAGSVGGIRLAQACGHRVMGDAWLNLTNTLAANAAENMGLCALTLSPELTLREIRAITEYCALPCAVLGYGYQRVMVSRACLIRGVRGRCDCASPLTLTDQTGAAFAVHGDRVQHLNSVYNSVPTFMADRIKELAECGAAEVRLFFLGETDRQTADILAMYRGTMEVKPPNRLTRGHFFYKL